ncbi:MAG: lipopolysaccharide biosynthesis protein [Bacilli bacterium]|nr:oligosaccharide flippase family protein [bacterium]
MERNKRLAKTTLIYFIGTFGSKILIFFLMPYYSHFLTAEQYGSINLIINLVPLLGPIFSLQVNETIFRFICDENKKNNIKNYISSSLMIWLFGMLSFIIIYIPLSALLKFNYTILFLLYFVLNYLNLYMQQILRGLKHNIDYTVSGVISTLVILIVNIICVPRLQEKSILIAYIISSLVVIIYSFIRGKIWQYISVKNINKENIKDMLKYSIPLIPNQISWWLNDFSGMYILKHYVGNAAAGLISFGNKFPSALTILNSVFLLAWTENTIFEYKSKDRNEYFSVGLTIFMNILIIISTLMLPIVKVYYDLFISPEYYKSISYIPILLVAMIFNALSAFLGTIYTASKKTSEAFKTTIVAAISNVALDVILIPRIGIYGYIFSLLISYIVFYITRRISINKLIKVKIISKEYLKYVILYILAVIIFYLGNNIINFIYAFVYSIIVIYLNRNVIKKIINSFKLKK